MITVVVAVYLTGMFLIGWMCQRRIQGPDDYLLASRKLGLPLCAATLAATHFGGVFSAGGAQKGFTSAPLRRLVRHRLWSGADPARIADSRQLSCPFPVHRPGIPGKALWEPADSNPGGGSLNCRAAWNHSFSGPGGRSGRQPPGSGARDRLHSGGPVFRQLHGTGWPVGGGCNRSGSDSCRRGGHGARLCPGTPENDGTGRSVDSAGGTDQPGRAHAALHTTVGGRVRFCALAFGSDRHVHVDRTGFLSKAVCRTRFESGPAGGTDCRGCPDSTEFLAGPGRNGSGGTGSVGSGCQWSDCSFRCDFTDDAGAGRGYRPGGFPGCHHVLG